MKKETFKEVRGYEGLYAVSNLGNIFSHKRGSLLNPRPRIEKRYRIVQLHKNGMTKNYRVARLVAMAFIPNPKNLPEVNHKNGISYEDRVENLEWCTHRENIIHSIRTGLRISAFGEKIGIAVLTDKKVKRARTEYRKGKNVAELGRKYGVDRKTMRSVVLGKTWKHLLPPSATV